ncbi:MAG: beta-ketoacyl-ACP synthase III [Fimbriiglobus sp.]
MSVDTQPFGLLGTGRCLPTRVMRNTDFPESLGTSDEWIRTRTGILERRYAGPDDSTASLALEAAKLAMAEATISPEQLDLIVCGTITPDTACPSVACRLQASLGCRMIPAFDVGAACSGFLYSLGIAEQFHRTGSVRHSLIIGADCLTRVMDHTDRNTCVLFGDGAGAAVFGPTAMQGLHGVSMNSDGQRGHLIHVPSRVTMDPTGNHLQMNGREVFRFAVTELTKMLVEAERQAASLGKTIDLVVPHQVNSRIIEAAQEGLGWSAARFYLNLAHTGNTAAATVPMALDEARKTGIARPGQTVMLVAFGGGLTWSHALLTLA